MVLGLVLLSFDVFGSARYLYFSTEVGLVLICAAVYFAAFAKARWSDPPNPRDQLPSKDWRLLQILVGAFFVLLAAGGALAWVVSGLVTSESAKAWFRSGNWYGFYLIVFVLFAVLVRRHLETVRLVPLFV